MCQQQAGIKPRTPAPQAIDVSIRPLSLELQLKWLNSNLEKITKKLFYRIVSIEFLSVFVSNSTPRQQLLFHCLGLGSCLKTTNKQKEILRMRRKERENAIVCVNVRVCVSVCVFMGGCMYVSECVCV